MLRASQISPDAIRILTARTLRGLADGLLSVLLAAYLQRLGFSVFQVSAIITGTLLGSAFLTLLLGLVGHRVDLRRVLLGACFLMTATGLGFAWFEAFLPLMLIAVVGTLNPTAGDVSIFLPAEQAFLAQSVDGKDRARLFAWYSLGGILAAGAGALLAGVPAIAASRLDWSLLNAERGAFVAYAAVGILIAVLYRRLPRSTADVATPSVPLAKSRRTVLQLAALFSLDSFGGGFAVQSLLVLWLHQRFDLSVAAAGQIFFAAGLVGAFSQLASAPLAARIGYIRTMAYTHLPANLFLVLAGIAPTPGLAITFLLLRSSLSQMDVPARQAYVMAVVPPEERAAAASVTNVPRSLAGAFAPLLAGWMLQHSDFGWPLICGGILKAVYDVLLLAAFRHRDSAHR